jgi:hypothetical protein
MAFGEVYQLQELNPGIGNALKDFIAGTRRCFGF